LIVIGVFIIIWTGYDLALRRFYAGKMPDGLELGWRFWHAAHNRCGVAAFSLSDATVRTLRLKGRQFFANAKNPEFDYDGWQETPLPGDPVKDAHFPAGLQCAVDLDGSLRRATFSALRRPGTFYRERGNSVTIVLPEEGIVLLSYLG